MTTRKVCPFISTAQIVPLQLNIKGASQTQPAINLQGLKGMAPASSVPVSNHEAVAGFGYKTNLRTEFAQKVESGELSPDKLPQEAFKFVAEPVSVPCMGDRCQGWDEAREDCGYKTQGVTPAAALAAARDLLNKANENFEGNLKESDDAE